ncbi:beta strand repeat-containing protein, partial [Sulfuricurvum sp.]|uniref:beta strand repeat-containing protein n=1 Tax=Sulfuricurvum sp. TaxID=2025608 RepID=UPI002E4BCC0E|nr:hypothetical protein [Sulfuricurvum sp.]
GLVGTGLTYSINVAGSDLLADTTIDASVAATDASGNSVTGSTTHTHSVDSAPVIANQTFTYAENTVSGVTIATVSASDNVGVTGYTFKATGTNLSADGFYQIDNSGVITLTTAGAASAVNDFESGTNTGSYVITAKDAAGNATDATITLNESNVVDTNPTPPILSVVGEGTTSQSIDISNLSSTTNGFSIMAKDVNGNTTTISTNSSPQGFGVSGVASGADTEIGYADGKGSEKLVVHFDHVQSSIDVSFAWKNPNETALVEFYKNGVLVGTGTYKGGSDAVDPAITLQPSNGSQFDEVRFGAVGSGDDYLIHSIAFDKAATSTDTITVYDNRSVELHVSSGLADTGTAQVLTTTIGGLPIGFVLSDGTHVFTATAGSTSVDISGWNQASLILTAPMNVYGTVALTVTATATDGSYTSSTSQNISIVVPAEATLSVVADNIITNAGSTTFVVPEWALLHNDVSANDIASVSNASGLSNTPTLSASGDVSVKDNNTAGGSFDYSVSDTVTNLNTNTTTTTSGTGTVTVSRDTNGSLDGTSSNDILIDNNALATTIMGGAGNDILIGSTTSSDVLYGGTGNDVLVYDALDTTVDGEAGTDTLVFNATDTTINFASLDTTNNAVKNIEVIDLTINGNHNITNLSLQDVIDMTDSNNTLSIIGDSADSVNVPTVSGNYSVTQTSDSGFDVYTYQSTNASDPTVTVKIEQDITHS